MITPFRGRDYRDPQKVSVYRNLNDQCWSIRAQEGKYKGKIVAHADQLHLMDVEFVVSEPGRKRVLSEQRKNVHAFVQGKLFTPQYTWDIRHEKSRVVYNPYHSGQFRKHWNDAPVSKAQVVQFDDDGKCWAHHAR